ncbi:hypothetical protein ACJZ2D_000807 [Fusarium nematophilum]
MQRHPPSLAHSSHPATMPESALSIANAFPPKKPDPMGIISLPPIPESAAYVTPAPGITHPRSNEDPRLEDPQFQQSVIEALLERNDALEAEQEISEAKCFDLKQRLQETTEELQNIEGRKAQLQLFQNTIDRQEDVIRELEQKTKARENDYARHASRLQAQLEELHAENNRLDRRHAAHIEELNRMHAEEEAMLEKQADQAAKIKSMEDQVDSLKKRENDLKLRVSKISGQCDALRTENRYVQKAAAAEYKKRQAVCEELDKIKHEQAELAHERAERDERQREVDHLKSLKAAMEEQNRKLSGRLAKLTQETQAATDDVQKRMMRKLREQHEIYAVDLNEAAQEQWRNQTPRTILTQKLISQCFPRVEDSHHAASFLELCSPARLTASMLDVQLSTLQARRFSENVLTTGDITIVSCGLCNLPKVAQGPGAGPLCVSEFAEELQPTRCCATSICTECYLRTLAKSLVSSWWTSLGAENWLKCPMSICDEALSVSDRASFENLLRQLGDRDMDSNIARFDRALLLRDALGKIEETLTDEALGLASTLHEQLVQSGRMYSLFDTKFTDKSPSHSSFTLEKVTMINAYLNGTTIRVPLFMQFLRRQTNPKQCSICAKVFLDVEYTSAQEWQNLCNRSHSEWMWRILQFPVKLGLECSHDIDFCTGCLQRCLKEQLERYGRSGCDQLACLSEGCGRRLSYEEVRLYADPETSAEYDGYLSLQALSLRPVFR